MYDQNHIYYRLQFKLRSSLLIGNGLSKSTDNDVLLNAVDDGSLHKSAGMLLLQPV